MVGEIKHIYFFLSVKGTAISKVLMLTENLILPTIQFCFRLDLSLGLKSDDVVQHVTKANCLTKIKCILIVIH